MTTATWNTRIRHDSDATYQEWRDEMVTKLGLMVAASKLVADETNITPGAGARAGSNAEQGYAVYHLADSLHGTAPVYIRFGFGTGGGTTSPRLQVTVGTSTNGSGVLGGTALTTIRNVSSSSAQTTDTLRVSYMCCVEGFLGIAWKLGTSAGSQMDGLLIVNRTCDSTGAPTVTGAQVVWGNGANASLSGTQALRFASTAAAYAARTATVAETALGLNPQAATSTLVGSDIQVFLGWTITPQVAPLFGVCGVLDTEAAVGVTFSTALVGSTSRTYIALNTLCGPFGPVGSTATGGLKFAMLYE